jgi:signal transduction histidine kinase
MLKSFFRSMTAKIFLILVGGTIIAGTLVMSLAMHERQSLDAHTRTLRTAERVKQLIQILDDAPVLARQAIADIASKQGIQVNFSQPKTAIGEIPDSEITTELKEALGNNQVFSVYESDSFNCPVRKSNDDSTITVTPHCETIFTNLKDGTHVRLDVAHRNLPPPPFRGNFVRDLLLFMCGLSLIALVIAHMATKPLRKLAQAAQDLSNNIEHKPLPINQGPAEVRDASLAFNSMQNSIRNHIQERTYMLAAIAHDLQTPLTRLRLRLEKVDDVKLRDQLVGDLTATQDLVREGLEFARILSINESLELVDLDSLIEAICHDAKDAGMKVSCEAKIGFSSMASPQALRRCIFNLIDNAVKYGNYAHVNAKQEGGMAIIEIIDGGEGIPESQLEAVFTPFNRLEQSRSRSFGGTGLGLTIANIIATRHKGLIKLSNIDATSGHGLIATLTLPIITP